jgi:hypothetical protein
MYVLSQKRNNRVVLASVETTRALWHVPRTKASANRAAAVLRMAASSLHHSHSALGAFFRRLKGRLGAPKAITATARKLASLIYNMLKHGTEYVDQGQEYYERRYQGRVLANLTRRARELGYHLVKTPESPAASV